MNQKLTLSVDEEAIKRGKRFAAAHDMSLSGVVENYLLLLDDRDDTCNCMPLSQKLRSLAGIGAGPYDEESYREHMEQRHGR